MKKIIIFYFPFLFLLSTCALEGANVIGPAGGFVFYDKGYYSDGWRYMEGSLVDAGEATWSGAIKIAAEFSQGGYSDWFLPNMNDLEQMMETAIFSFEESEYNFYDELTKIVGYWSSDYNSYVYRKRFTVYTYSDYGYTDKNYYVRPARRF